MRNDEDWSSLLAENPKVLWGLVADVVKAVKAQEGERKTGRRPAVSVSSLDELYEILFPATYASDPFPQALDKLLVDGAHSQRSFAVACGHSQATVNRMLSGKVVPTVQLLEQLSTSLGVKPMFFAEYRALKIGQLVTDVLAANPDMSADVVRRMFGANA